MVNPPWDSPYLVSELTILCPNSATMFNQAAVDDSYFYGSPNSYGYEYYHGYSHSYSYPDPCVYQVDNTNPGFYFVESCSSIISTYFEALKLLWFSDNMVTFSQAKKHDQQWIEITEKDCEIQPFIVHYTFIFYLLRTGSSKEALKLVKCMAFFSIAINGSIIV